MLMVAKSILISSSGGAEKKHARHLLTYGNEYLPSVLAASPVLHTIAMLNGEPIRYAQSYVALGSGDGWWEEETDPGYAE